MTLKSQQNLTLINNATALSSFEVSKLLFKLQVSSYNNTKVGGAYRVNHHERGCLGRSEIREKDRSRHQCSSI